MSSTLPHALAEGIAADPAALRALAAALAGDPTARCVLQAALGTAPRPPSPLLTVGEAAVFLRCKPQRIRNLLSEGRLTRHKDGGRVLISREEIERHLTGETVGPLGAALGGILC